MRFSIFIVALLLMASTTLAIDVRREAVHFITDELKDLVTYTDYFYGMWANGTLQFMQNYDDQLGFIQRRVAGVDIGFLSVHSSGNVLITNVTGVYPDFVIRTGDTYRIGGKGFTDDICTSRSPPMIPAIEQEFMFYISIPENMVITTMPADSEEDLGHISYKHSAKYESGVAYEYLYLNVKEDIDVDTYCTERARVDAALKQGFTAEDKVLMGPTNVTLLILITAVLISILVYLTKSK
jgi:hypothetical protein